jgi:hypothetical protein
LRPVESLNQISSLKSVTKDKIKVLLISEPLIAVAEVVPYIKRMLEHDGIEVAIKVRPMVKDVYYESMKSKLPEIKNLKVYDGKLSDVAEKFDVFIGTNSTAVVEASLFGKLSILLNTVMFGDYFDMDTIVPNCTLLVKDPDMVCREILSRIKNEKRLKTIEKIRCRFFGDNKDGAQWIVDQL